MPSYLYVKALVAPILASNVPSSDNMVNKNIIWTFQGDWLSLSTSLAMAGLLGEESNSVTHTQRLSMDR